MSDQWVQLLIGHPFQTVFDAGFKIGKKKRNHIHLVRSAISFGYYLKKSRELSQIFERKSLAWNKNESERGNALGQLDVTAQDFALTSKCAQSIGSQARRKMAATAWFGPTGNANIALTSDDHERVTESWHDKLDLRCWKCIDMVCLLAARVILAGFPFGLDRVRDMCDACEYFFFVMCGNDGGIAQSD